jgi:hypothetical protein
MKHEPVILTKQTSTVSYYNCTKCPAYCCSIYERVQVTKRDIKRLAKHFGVDYETRSGVIRPLLAGRADMRRKADPTFGQACKFLRSGFATLHHLQRSPSVCREFPDRARCAYYDLLTFERSQQGDETVLPLVQITFRNGHK